MFDLIEQTRRNGTIQHIVAAKQRNLFHGFPPLNGSNAHLTRVGNGLIVKRILGSVVGIGTVCVVGLYHGPPDVLILPVGVGLRIVGLGIVGFVMCLWIERVVAGSVVKRGWARIVVVMIVVLSVRDVFDRVLGMISLGAAFSRALATYTGLHL